MSLSSRCSAPLRQSTRLLTSAARTSPSPRILLPTQNRGIPSSCTRSTPLQPLRPFSTSPALYKKKSKKAAPPPEEEEFEEDDEDVEHNKKGKEEVAEFVDHLDFTPVTEAFVPIDAHFRNQFQILTHGGRFNPEALGALPIPVKIDNELLELPLSELAQIVPRQGRTISLLLNDKDYVKPIMSAVQASKDFNQQPQRSEDNELELLMKVEAERKEDVIRRIKEAAHGWRERVRAARGKHEKTLSGWHKKKVITGDMSRKAVKELQKLQDKKMKEIDAEESRIVKSLNR